MKESEFWERMEHHLGVGYARVWAMQHHLGDLGDRTVDQALTDGASCKQIWRAVAAHLELAPGDS